MPDKYETNLDKRKSKAIDLYEYLKNKLENYNLLEEAIAHTPTNSEIGFEYLKKSENILFKI